jgi:hypothetical protein
MSTLAAAGTHPFSSSFNLSIRCLSPSPEIFVCLVGVQLDIWNFTSAAGGTHEQLGLRPTGLNNLG